MYTFSFTELIILVLWLFGALSDYGKFSYIWQLKEYRIDRFRDYLQTKKGKQFLSSYPICWRSLVALMVLLLPLPSLLYLKYLLIGLLVFDLAYNVSNLLKEGFVRPIPTKKIILIVLLSIGLEVSFIWVTQSWYSVLVVLIFRFFIISISVAILYIPTKIIKNWYIRRATKKIRQLDNLKVVGITGSYGKTSVKNYLSKILSSKYEVEKTPKNINTPIGVSRHILSTDFKDIDIYVVEMGAYRIGEIKKICDMVKPSVGILTAINEEHLSLFGSVEAIQTAKYELLRSITEEGLVVTNNDNKYCREYLDELDAQVKTFGLDDNKDPDFLIQKVESKQDQLYFSGELEGKNTDITASVVGGHNAENIAAAVLVARYLKVSLEEIKEQCLDLETPDRRLNIINYGRTVIIDDSYNANPKGFKAALNILSSYSSDKKHIVITRGMLELGEKSFKKHKMIGEEISFYADELVIISQDAEQALKAGILEKYRINVKTIYDIEELLEYVKSLYDTNSVILVENKLPPKVYGEIKEDN